MLERKSLSVGVDVFKRMYSISLFLLFFTYIFVRASVLNIEELNSIHYNIDIVNIPVLKNKDWSTDIVTVTNKHGQEYICTLPEVKIPENENKKEEDLLDQLVDISELLKPMEAAPCLIKKKDWWSYEFCYGSVIKQYHLEDNKVVGTILILGKYESEYNWKNNSKTKNKLQKFHAQNYVNGTRCDITGEPRRAEVRFHCEEGVGDYIQQVDEPESCRYVFTIATTRVCHHPYLKPNPNRTPHNINCAPALSQDEFDQYQKVQEIKKDKLEKVKNSLLEFEKNSENDLTEKGDLVNAFGDNDTDEDDSKWSIKLVTIPISKKGKFARNRIIDPEDIESLKGESDIFSSTIPENENIHIDKAEGFESVTSYLTEKEILKREFDQNMKDFLEKDVLKKDGIEEEMEESEEKEDEAKIVKKQFEVFKKRMEKLMGRWMEIQNEDHIHVLLDKIKINLDKNVQKLEEKANTFSEESLNEYLNDLLEMTEKYKKKLPKVEDLYLLDEEKVMDALKSLTDLLTEAEIGVLKAIHHKKKLDRLEKYLESHLKQTEKQLLPQANEEEEEDDDNKGKKKRDDANVQYTDSETPDKTSFFAHSTSSTPNPPSQRFEDPDPTDPIDPDTREGQSATGADLEAEIGTDEVKITNEKSFDEDRKLRLEQSIKEKLQKSGLDNIGRKIEVKILTPNYLDDDEKDSLSSLSQEETEAFHNMIVNILSASAEEFQERERHKSLESNYNFRLLEPDINIDEIITPDEFQDSEESAVSASASEIADQLTGTAEILKEEVTDDSDNFGISDDSDNNNIIDDDNSISNDDSNSNSINSNNSEDET